MSLFRRTRFYFWKEMRSNASGMKSIKNDWIANALNWMYTYYKVVGSKVAQFPNRMEKKHTWTMRHLFLLLLRTFVRDVENVRSLGQPIVLKNSRDSINYPIGTCFCTAGVNPLLYFVFVLLDYLWLHIEWTVCIEQLERSLFVSGYTKWKIWRHYRRRWWFTDCVTQANGHNGQESVCSQNQIMKN